MSEERTDIVRRVVDSLATTDEAHGSAVDAYFEADRDVLIAAARETLAATGTDTGSSEIAARIEGELLDGLRMTAPPGGVGRFLSRVYMRRGAIVGVTTLAAILTALLVFFL